jgi:hypothetical protein
MAGTLDYGSPPDGGGELVAVIFALGRTVFEIIGFQFSVMQFQCKQFFALLIFPNFFIIRVLDIRLVVAQRGWPEKSFGRVFWVARR